MGTMGYMSPEQVRGLPVDHRSDIFSFGTILYEMLSGKRAFKRDTASDTIAAILKEDPPELTQSGRNISPALDRIVRHCLEKDRDRRFHSAHDIAFALSEASSPTTATRRTARGATDRQEEGSHRRCGGRRSRRGGCPSPAPAAAAARSEAGGVKRVAVLPFENLGAPEDDYFADGIADAVRGKLTSVPGLEVIARGSSTPYKKTTKTPQEIARELDAHYLLTATVRWQKGGGGNRVQVSPELVEIRASGAPASRWQQPFDAAITDVFQVQSDIATKVAQALGGALAAGEQKRLSEKPTQNLAAYDAFLKGEEAANGLPPAIPPACARRSASTSRPWRWIPALRRRGRESRTPIRCCTPTASRRPALAERARQAAEKAVALAPNRPEGYLALGNYERVITLTSTAPSSSTRRGCVLLPGDAAFSGERRLPSGASGAGMRRRALQAGGTPRSAVGQPFDASAKRSSACGAIPRRGRLSTEASPSRPPTSR